MSQAYKNMLEQVVEESASTVAQDRGDNDTAKFLLGMVGVLLVNLIALYSLSRYRSSGNDRSFRATVAVLDCGTSRKKETSRSVPLSEVYKHIWKQSKPNTASFQGVILLAALLMSVIVLVCLVDIGIVDSSSGAWLSVLLALLLWILLCRLACQGWERIEVKSDEMDAPDDDSVEEGRCLLIQKDVSRVVA